MKKTIWITRDDEGGADPDILMIHTSKPIKQGRKGRADYVPTEGESMAIPIPKTGSKHRVILYFD